MLELYAHPFSSYCWKVLIPLYENATPFEYRALGPDFPEHGETLARLTPTGRFPLLVDDGWPVLESSVIIEHLDVHHPGAVRFVPEDRDAALEVRMLDRIFDNQVMGQMQRVVFDAIRPAERRDSIEVAEAKAMLERAYAWLDRWMEGCDWASGGFSLADCAAAPSLFYSDWVHPIGESYRTLRAYRSRLLARPSVARAVNEARPYRALFPLGAPDRD